MSREPAVTYWVVVEILTGERRVFRSRYAAKACAAGVAGGCEMFSRVFRRKGGGLVEVDG